MIYGTGRQSMCCSHGSLATSLPWLVNTSDTDAAGAAGKRVIDSWASLRLCFTSLAPDVARCPSASYFPHTHFHTTTSLRNGKEWERCRYRQRGGRNRAGKEEKGRKRKKHKHLKVRARTNRTSGEAAPQKGSHCRKGVSSHWKSPGIQKCYWKGNS